MKNINTTMGEMLKAVTMYELYNKIKTARKNGAITESQYTTLIEKWEMI